MKVQFGRKELSGVQIRADTTVLEARKAIAAARRLSYHRVELRGPEPSEEEKKAGKRPAKYDDDAKKLSTYGLTDSSPLFAKDLGPQFSYRGVFLIEYLGPILIILGFCLRPAYYFGENATPLRFWESLTVKHATAAEGSTEWRDFVQGAAVALWIAHFVKRELETLFVHKFSRATMPLSNLFKNSTYYWGFAAMVGYPLVHPAFTAPGKTQVAVAAALWGASQLTNLAVHVYLASLRPAEGSKVRPIPGGKGQPFIGRFLFSLVSCPNYTAEVLGWVAWTAFTQIATSGLFTLVGLLQMTQWALGKHSGYRKDKDNGEQYKKLGRKAIIPFVI